ncbi:MAG: transposase [Chitinophagales bacterium]|nr:transposase [Chitinophagales bacterium]
MSAYKRYELYFFTATILDWQPVLQSNTHKQVILDSLKFLVHENRIHVCAFCIMNNHIHLLWQIIHPQELKNVQRDFLKYTAQQILKQLRNTNHPLLESLHVNAKDRKYQVWQRNPLSVPVRSESVLKQKLNYIHENPVKANLCNLPEDYLFSSAKYYETGTDDWDFITHYIFD